MARTSPETVESIDAQLHGTESKIVELLADVARLRQYALELRTRRNALTRLCALPEDIILAILYVLHGKDLARASDVCGPPLSSACLRGGWTTVMGACTRLRSIALSAPLLWRSLHLRSRPEWLALCAERSHGLPHALVLRPCVWGSRNVSVNLKTYIALAHDVRIELYGSEFIHITKTLLEGTLPSLRHLVCAMGTGDVLLSDRFLGGLSSQLRTLELRNTVISLKAPTLASLTSLALYAVDTQGEPQALFELLRGAPLLEELFVSRVDDASMEGVRLDSISLPRLRKTRITANRAWVAALMGVLPLSQDEHHFHVSGGLARLDAGAHIRLQAHAHAVRLVREARAVPLERVMWDARRRDYRYCVRSDAWHGSVRVIYVDHGNQLNMVPAAAHSGPTLRVRKDAVERLLARAAAAPDAWLCGVEHLLMDYWPSAIGDLKTWLQARAAAGQPLRTLDFCAVRKRREMDETAVALREAQLVAEILVDHEAWAPRLTPDTETADEEEEVVVGVTTGIQSEDVACYWFRRNVWTDCVFLCSVPYKTSYSQVQLWRYHSRSVEGRRTQFCKWLLR
jgi:hypothetical protein